MADAAKTKWVVYILRCADDTLYTGITNDMARRLTQHNDGTGAKYTKPRRPCALVYEKAAADRSEASKRELAIKMLSRQDKERLIH